MGSCSADRGSGLLGTRPRLNPKDALDPSSGAEIANHRHIVAESACPSTGEWSWSRLRRPWNVSPPTKSEVPLEVERREDLVGDDPCLEGRRAGRDPVNHKIGHRLAEIVPRALVRQPGHDMLAEHGRGVWKWCVRWRVIEPR